MLTMLQIEYAFKGAKNLLAVVAGGANCIAIHLGHMSHVNIKRAHFLEFTDSESGKLGRGKDKFERGQ